MKALHVYLTIIFFSLFLNPVNSQNNPKGEFSSVDLNGSLSFEPLGSTFSNGIFFKDNTGSTHARIMYGHFPSSLTGKLILSQNTGSILIDDQSIEIKSDNTTGFLMNSSQQIGIASTTIPSAIGSINLNSYKLFVNGGVLAKEVRVRTDWADYVFDPSYSLPTLQEVASFIDTNGHLPNVPSADQVATEGINIGDIARIQQEKIEELTLYTIQQDAQLSAQQAKIESLEERLARLEKLLND